MDAELMERISENDRDWRRYMMVKLDELHVDQKQHAEKMERFKTEVEREQTAIKIGMAKLSMKAGFVAAISSAFGSAVTISIAFATAMLKKF